MKRGRDYLVKMFATNTCLEILVTDKKTGEEWQCNYDNLFIENLTHKTGNYKQFDIFVTMIKSGLLKTSSSISLNLLTLEDLEAMRIKRLRSHLTCTHSTTCENQNRRYLIITYTVEFDRIHYPIPLEYCGAPDPVVLQATIHRLEEEILTLKQKKDNRLDNQKNFVLERRIDELNTENKELREEIRQLKKLNGKTQKNEVYMLQKAITNLEKSIMNERRSHHKLVEKLRTEKKYLIDEVEKLKNNEKILKSQLRKVSVSPSRMSVNGMGKFPVKKSESVQLIYQRSPTSIRRNYSHNQPIKVKPESPKYKRLDNLEKSNSRTISRARNVSSTTRMRSRSSSASSSLRSQLSPLKRPNTFQVKDFTYKDRTSRRSRSNSVSSVDSPGRKSANAKTMKRSMSNFQNNDLDFQILEERIEVLQKLLNENIKLQ
ncbi:coiled-coil domain-containing protein 61 isoform X2 [Agrilus planipennis]|uniref:Centrosomal protein CCDC61 n=1 Tax=Agrilus planipennis TaxID=224129 RepID=A0A1W4WW24_AGRPL|nr:coiled-coil domain-containing protein 61 isoform X2 [Agrilus planipennis]